MNSLEELRRRAEVAADRVGGTKKLADIIEINRISLENFINKRLNQNGKPRQLSRDYQNKLMDALGVMRHNAYLPGGYISADSPQLLREMVELHFELLERDRMVALGLSQDGKADQTE